MGMAKTKSKEILKAKAILAPADDDGLEGVFYNFCGAGHAEMDGKSFQKMCKDTALVDKKVVGTDIDLIFKKVVKIKTMDFHTFEKALDIIADKKGVKKETVRTLVLESNRRVVHGTKSEAVRFHDDKSTFTGIKSQVGEQGKGKSPHIRRRPAPRSKLPKAPALKDIPLDLVIDNRDLWKTFGSHTKAGRFLKRIYSDEPRWSPERTTDRKGFGVDQPASAGGLPWPHQQQPFRASDAVQVQQQGLSKVWSLPAIPGPRGGQTAMYNAPNVF